MTLYHQCYLRRWDLRGVEVKVLDCDISLAVTFAFRL